MRRRVPLLLALSTVVVGAVAYGCGDDPEPTSGSDDGGASSSSSGGASSSSSGASSSSSGGASSSSSGGSSSSSSGGSSSGGADAGKDATLDASGSDASDAAVDAYEAGPPPGPLSPTYVDYDINHVLIAGQSNAIAASATPVLSTAQPYGNVMLNGGVLRSAFAAITNFVPLVESGRESSTSGFANQATYLATQEYQFGVRAGYPDKHDVLAGIHGRSGHTYWCLRKGGCNWQPSTAFAQALFEVQGAKTYADGLGKTYVVRAINAIHGESDDDDYTMNGGNPTEYPNTGTDGTPDKIQSYDDALVEWQEDYEREIKAITGQAQPIPLFISQLSGRTYSTYSPVAPMQLKAHVRAPGKVVLIGPAYQLTFLNDCQHFTNNGQRRLGEYFAKVYARVVFGGEKWEPVRPKQITRAGAVVTVKYHVPKPPLVIDTARITDPGHYGFDFYDGSASPPAITAVAVTAPDTVTITLSKVPTGPKPRLTYAENAAPQPNACPGDPFGARGNLRDSDDTVSRSGYELFDWGVIFDEVVP